MQEELLRMKKELAGILAANKQLKQALREVIERALAVGIPGQKGVSGNVCV